MKRLVIGTFVIAIVSMIVWSNLQKKPIEVFIKPVKMGVAQSTVSNTRAGTIKACQRSSLSMRIGGRVSELYVNEGDVVEKDQLLLQLWNNDQKAYLSQAQSHLEAAKINEVRSCLTANHERREANRVASLHEKQLTSQNQLDSVKTQAQVGHLACNVAKVELEGAKASLELQEALLEQTLLKAPFSGVVAEINSRVGEFLSPSPPGVMSQPAIDLIDTHCLYVTASIDEVDAMSLRVGMPTEITLDAFRGRVFPGALSRIAPYVVDKEKQARTVDIDVKFSELPEDVVLLIGYSADIKIIVNEKKDALLLPLEALFDENKVYTYDSATSQVRLKTLKLGIGNWTEVEVLEGLNVDDKVVTSLDIPELKDGLIVKVNNSKN